MSAGRYATRNIEGFGAGLRELGYFESRHVTLALRFAECMPERMQALATYLFNVHRISTDRHDASFWLMIAKPPISFRAIYCRWVWDRMCGRVEPAAPDAPVSKRSSRIRKSTRAWGTGGTGGSLAQRP